ncbi:MAG: hypothetical protein ACRD5B_19405 [Nitrososphaeraceae archaeon]
MAIRTGDTNKDHSATPPPAPTVEKEERQDRAVVAAIQEEPREGAGVQELQGYLNYLEKKFSEKRKEQSDKNFWVMIGISIVAFVSVFFTISYSSALDQVSLPSFNQANPSSQLTQNAFIDTFQIALVLSLSVAIIPLIVFSANRSRTIQHQNDELAALNQDVLRLRNRVLLRRQEEVLTEIKMREEEMKMEGKPDDRFKNIPGSETKRYWIEKGDSEVPKKYEELSARLRQVAQEQKLPLTSQDASTQEIVNSLVSRGKLPKEAVEEFDIIERIRDKLRTEAMTADEYERFELAMMRLDLYLEKSYGEQY